MKQLVLMKKVTSAREALYTQSVMVGLHDTPEHAVQHLMQASENAKPGTFWLEYREPKIHRPI